MGARPDLGFRNSPLAAQRDGDPVARGDRKVLGLGLSKLHDFVQEYVPV